MTATAISTTARQIPTTTVTVACHPCRGVTRARRATGPRVVADGPRVVADRLRVVADGLRVVVDRLRRVGGDSGSATSG
ncbi:hypothetical protein [Frankia sp. Cppng1_Ct_nod]|uniref:hypothetical protein n=1 Tax=Frankia sp. Cppng1_Ct_nod TaxID=2897162 RepID=UPI001040E717|nr:hypothetical protein [Frankia sp. Cppng1_Ct_nod]